MNLPKARVAAPLGVVLGLGTALAVAPLLEGGGVAPLFPRGRLLSDCEGALEELVIHYVPETAETVVPAYRDFLGQLPEDVRVRVVCRDRAAFDDLVARVGEHACDLSPVLVDHPITGWSRDRWLALRARDDEERSVVVSPRGEEGAAIWPARRGDERVGDDLGAMPALRTSSVRSDLFFDGGDFVADDETAFVTPGVRRRNVHHTVEDEAALTVRLAHLLDREVVLLDVAPDHHAGMFMMTVGNRTVLVGDPAAARDLFPAGDDGVPRIAAPLPGGGDFSEETQARFDAVARACADAGYRVVRMPLVPAADGRTYLTSLNAILDQRDGHRVVYMPVFAGAEPLNDAAAQIWRELGYQVHRVDCTETYRHFGSLRCLVNILRRGE